MTDMVSAPSSPSWLEFSEPGMHEDFDRTPYRIRHHLSDHPLLALPRLIELGKALPATSTEYNSGNLSVGQDPALTPRNGLSVEETLRRIEECGSWMVLKHVEQDPEYSRLIDECLDQVAPVIRSKITGMCARAGFIFVSSPNAVTPYHADFEYNFLLQVRGTKCMTVFDGNDRTVMNELARERSVSGAHRNLEYREEFAAKGMPFDLRPGEGVHVPLSSPHWVKVGGEVSVSLSITFQSRESDRLRAVHHVNAWLRNKLHLNPREQGLSPWLDSLKYTAHRVSRKAQVLMKRAVRSKGQMS